MNELEIILLCAFALVAGVSVRLYRVWACTRRLLKRRSLELHALANAMRRCEQRFEQRCEALESELSMLTQDVRMFDRERDATAVGIEEAVRLAKDGVHAATLVSNGFSVAEADLAVSLYGHSREPTNRSTTGPAVPMPDPSVQVHRQAPPRDALQPAMTEPPEVIPTNGAVGEHPRSLPKDWMGEAQFRSLAEKLRAAARSQPAPFGTVSDRHLDDDLISLSAAALSDKRVGKADKRAHTGRRIQQVVG